MSPLIVSGDHGLEDLQTCKYTIVLSFSFKSCHFMHRNKCCVHNGTLVEADSIIEDQTIGCEKVNNTIVDV